MSSSLLLLSILPGLLALSNNHQECLGKDCESLSSNRHRAERVTPERCTVLQNTQNAVYTINAKVGSPPTEFRLVADTGSNVLVIPGQNCKECKKANKRLYDFSASSTSLKTRHASRITYGSGTVEGPLIHDTVEAIGVKSKNQSMLVMQHEAIQSFSNFDFDGIMGMGMPESSMGTKDQKAGDDRSFFAQAGVDAFTMCFDKGAKPNGVLKLGSKRNHTFNFEKVIGKVHWGVTLSGASTEGKQVDGVCTDGQKCAVIVDSGTTLMMGPASHLVKIYSRLCDHLPECASMAQGTTDDATRSELFMTILLTCPSSMASLPPLKFKLGESHISLGMETYIMKAHSKELSMNNFMSGLTNSLNFGKYKAEVCVPAFMPMKMKSRRFGPVWIFGMPVMREYTVMFKRNHNNSGSPAVGFSKTKKCGGCGEEQMISDFTAKVVEKHEQPSTILPYEPTRLSPIYIRKPSLSLYENSEEVRL